MAVSRSLLQSAARTGRSCISIGPQCRTDKEGFSLDVPVTLICQIRVAIMEEMMQTRLGIDSVVLALIAALSVQTATACPREIVAAAVERWTSVFAENNPDTITALYSKDAV